MEHSWRFGQASRQGKYVLKGLNPPDLRLERVEEALVRGPPPNRPGQSDEGSQTSHITWDALRYRMQRFGLHELNSKPAVSDQQFVKHQAIITIGSGCPTPTSPPPEGEGNACVSLSSRERGTCMFLPLGGGQEGDGWGRCRVSLAPLAHPVELSNNTHRVREIPHPPRTSRLINELKPPDAAILIHG